MLKSSRCSHPGAAWIGLFKTVTIGFTKVHELCAGENHCEQFLFNLGEALFSVR